MESAVRYEIKVLCYEGDHAGYAEIEGPLHVGKAYELSPCGNHHVLVRVEETRSDVRAVFCGCEPNLQAAIELAESEGYL